MGVGPELCSLRRRRDGIHGLGAARQDVRRQATGGSGAEVTAAVAILFFTCLRVSTGGQKRAIEGKVRPSAFLLSHGADGGLCIVVFVAYDRRCAFVVAILVKWTCAPVWRGLPVDESI